MTRGEENGQGRHPGVEAVFRKCRVHRKGCGMLLPEGSIHAGLLLYMDMSESPPYAGWRCFPLSPFLLLFSACFALLSIRCVLCFLKIPETVIKFS